MAEMNPVVVRGCQSQMQNFDKAGLKLSATVVPAHSSCTC